MKEGGPSGPPFLFLDLNFGKTLQAPLSGHTEREIDAFAAQ